MISKRAIIYHPDLAPRFADYGIPVPLVADRSQLLWSDLLHLSPELREFDLKLLPIISWQDVMRAHDLDYVARLLDQDLCSFEVAQCFELNLYPLQKAKRPLSEMPQDVLRQCAGTLAASEIALKDGFAFYLGGGMHHAMRFAGRGFCLLNDIVIAARRLQNEGKIKRALVIDVDAHKGDGTAQIAHGDESITTLSVHMAKGWPLDGSLGSGPWDIPSDIDVALDLNQEDQYLARLQESLNRLNLQNYDLAFVVLGSDAWESDELPSSAGIKLSTKQMKERDELIEKTLSFVNLPRVYLMGGGYGPHAHKPYVNFLVDKLVR